MAKYVQVKFPNGDEFKIPADIIAGSRASYYANREGGDQTGTMHNTEEWQKVYDDEFIITLEEDGELTDWLWNNMNWSDVEKYAIKVPTNSEKYNHGKHWMDIQAHEDYEVITE